MIINTQVPILLLEDQALISLFLQDRLRQAGYMSITATASVASAAEWLRETTPAAVVMETYLKRRTCDGIAATLAELRIPIVVHSVERDRRDKFPYDRCACWWIEKPCDPDNIILAVSNAVKLSPLAKLGPPLTGGDGNYSSIAAHASDGTFGKRA